tara:strand:- start:1066 stop:1905 length:840 start_codon:yes stop_codon:yes gene_type:complete
MEDQFSWTEWHLHLEIVFGVLFLQSLYLFAIGPLREKYNLSPQLDNKRLFYFTIANVIAYFSLTSFIHELADRFLFSAHMTQHLLLILIAIPLFIKGVPPWLWTWIFQIKIIRIFFRIFANPIIAFFLSNIVIFGFHVPWVYDLSLSNHWLHIIEHIVFMFGALVLWWPLLGVSAQIQRLGYPVRLIYLFFQTLPMGFVGAAITFSRGEIYNWYSDLPLLWGLSRLEDQQIGGLIMKVPGAFIFFLFMGIIFFQWFNESQQNNSPDSFEELVGSKEKLT